MSAPAANIRPDYGPCGPNLRRALARQALRAHAEAAIREPLLRIRSASVLCAPDLPDSWQPMPETVVPPTLPDHKPA